MFLFSSKALVARFVLAFQTHLAVATVTDQGGSPLFDLQA